jgi:membrane protease YdiL (CAAX protease family)
MDATTTTPRTWHAYHRATRTATFGFVSTLPLLALYEVGIVLANAGRPAPVRVGADVWIKDLLAWMGVTGHLALGAAVVVVGALVVWAERRKDVRLRRSYFAWMVGESLVYAVVVAFAVSMTVGLLVLAAPVAALAGPIEVGGLGLQLALSIGAGLYEELVFRVILVGGLFLVLRRVMQGRTAAYLVAAVVGAAVFNAVHYVGAYGDAFTLASFTFRFLFGLALNALFLARGFGVAAWTHALYDVLIVTGVL